MFDISSLAINGIKKVLDSIIKQAKNPIKNKVQGIYSLSSFDQIKNHIDNLDRIKTIYQPDKLVSFSSIYFPLKVERDGHSFAPENLDILFDNVQRALGLLIEGTAGQGKSFFMRYLCIQELKRGIYVPLLVQLRLLKNNQSLLNLLIQEFSMYELGEDLKVFLYLCKTGKMAFFLDGFDEISNQNQNRVALEIEQLATRFRKSKFIISSRPEIRIRSSFLFEIVKLCEFSKTEQLNFVRHMMEDEIQINLINQAIDRSQFISSVVTTPLFLILLMIAYKFESKVPENMIEFYTLLFPTMMYRHDKTKIGFNREILSKIGTSKFQELFEVFSYISADRNKLRFNNKEYNDMLCEACCYIDVNRVIDDKEIENILHDITKVTCLVIEDGFDKYSFIHKTIQEYFAASFISKSGEENISNFFNYNLEKYENYQIWSQVNLFLSGLSEYLYLKDFFKPLNEKFFGTNKFKKSSIKEILGEQSIIYITDNGEFVKYIEQKGYFQIINSILQISFRDNLINFLKYNERNLCIHIATISEFEYNEIHENSINNLYVYDLLKQMHIIEEFNHFINEKMKILIKNEQERIKNKISKFTGRSNIIKMPKKPGFNSVEKSETPLAKAEIAILTVIPDELNAARKAININLEQRVKMLDGTVCYHGTIPTKLLNSSYRIVLTCIGGAGNSGAAATTMDVINHYKPLVVFLVGIAAGIRGKVRIGQVVFSERVVAYEPAALVADDAGHRVESRPEIERVAHSILQDLVTYVPEPKRINKVFRRIGGVFPSPSPGQECEFKDHVVDSIEATTATIASGDKLLRDPAKFLEIRKIHGKIEVGEMEAFGVVEACRRGRVPWLIVRGISDFGDQLKNDLFHRFAASTAASVLSDFLSNGLDLSK